MLTMGKRCAQNKKRTCRLMQSEFHGPIQGSASSPHQPILTMGIAERPFSWKINTVLSDQTFSRKSRLRRCDFLLPYDAIYWLLYLLPFPTTPLFLPPSLYV